MSVGFKRPSAKLTREYYAPTGKRIEDWQIFHAPTAEIARDTIPGDFLVVFQCGGEIDGSWRIEVTRTF